MLSRQRFVVVGIVLLALVAFLPLSHLFEWVWVYFGWDDTLFGSRSFSLSTALSLVIVTAAAVFCFLHKTTYGLLTEVAEELSKVTWPSREETGNATIVVLVTVLICSLYLGIFDAVWLWVTDMVLGVDKAMPS